MIQRPNQSINPSIEHFIAYLSSRPSIIPLYRRVSYQYRATLLSNWNHTNSNHARFGRRNEYSSLIDRAGLRSALLAWRLLLLLLLLLSSQWCSQISPWPLLAVLRVQLALLSSGWRHLAHGGTSALHGHGGLLLLGRQLLLLLLSAVVEIVAVRIILPSVVLACEKRCDF